MKIKRLSLKCFDTAGTAPVITRAMETNAQINAILSFSFCLVYAQNARTKNKIPVPTIKILIIVIILFSPFVCVFSYHHVYIRRNPASFLSSQGTEFRDRKYAHPNVSPASEYENMLR